MPVQVPQVRILVVDDDKAICEYVQTVLEKDGFSVKTLTNPLLAEEEVRHGDFHLILLDLMMPIMDGFAVLAKVKEDPTLRDTPVIIVSAENDSKSVVKGIKQGAEDYLTKPVDTAQFLRKVKDFLG